MSPSIATDIARESHGSEAHGPMRTRIRALAAFAALLGIATLLGVAMASTRSYVPERHPVQQQPTGQPVDPTDHC